MAEDDCPGYTCSADEKEHPLLLPFSFCLPVVFFILFFTYFHFFLYLTSKVVSGQHKD